MVESSTWEEMPSGRSLIETNFLRSAKKKILWVIFHCVIQLLFRELFLFFTTVFWSTSYFPRCKICRKIVFRLNVIIPTFILTITITESRLVYFKDFLRCAKISYVTKLNHQSSKNWSSVQPAYKKRSHFFLVN